MRGKTSNFQRPIYARIVDVGMQKDDHVIITLISKLGIIISIVAQKRHSENMNLLNLGVTQISRLIDGAVMEEDVLFISKNKRARILDFFSMYFYYILEHNIYQGYIGKRTLAGR